VGLGRATKACPGEGRWTSPRPATSSRGRAGEPEDPGPAGQKALPQEPSADYNPPPASTSAPSPLPAASPPARCGAPRRSRARRPSCSPRPTASCCSVRTGQTASQLQPPVHRCLSTPFGARDIVALGVRSSRAPRSWKMAQLRHGPRLDLADALPGQVEMFATSSKSARFSRSRRTQPEDLPLTLVQGTNILPTSPESNDAAAASKATPPSGPRPRRPARRRRPRAAAPKARGAPPRGGDLDHLLLFELEVVASSADVAGGRAGPRAGPRLGHPVRSRRRARAGGRFGRCWLSRG